jgi:UDP-GlcNAc:undecaprenyl-phosphate GlcNAc-1-phosphate transferase
MLSVLIALILAVVVSASATPLVRRLALAIGAVDAPTARRVHTRRTPRLGGIAIVLGFFLPLLALFAANTSVAQMLFARPRQVAGLIAGSLLCAGLGAYDDMVGLGAKRKLFVQCVAASVAYAGGFCIDAVTLPLLGEIRMGIFALPATVLWIVAIVNALNLIDGLDGLAAGIAFFACVTNFVVAQLGANILVSLVSATLAGSIIGFLFHNFNPATIFMGDSGSMFLGFIVATTSLLGSSSKGGAAVAILVPIVALGVPIVDTLLAMVRRFLERRSIFSADRGHIHHRLLDLGLSHRRAVLILYGASIFFTLAALAIYIGRSWQVGLALASITVVTVGLVRFVGYFNSALLRRNQRERRREPWVDALRRATPEVLPRVELARTNDDVRAHLEHFAAATTLLAVELIGPAGGTGLSWRWEAPLAEDQAFRECVSAKYPVVDANGTKHELKFVWDAPTGDVNPQAEILLQLVADAVERQMTRVQRAREAARSGRLRPVG